MQKKPLCLGLKFLALGLPLGLAVLLVLWLVMGPAGHGQAALERVVAHQVRSIAEARLHPRLRFADLDYHFPTTVILHQVRMETDRPSGGNPFTLLSAERMELELAELPQEGRPIQIQAMVCDGLRLFLERSPGEGGGLVGLNELVKDPRADSSVDAAPPRLSDVFRIRRIEVREGALHFAVGGQATEAFELDGISAELEVAPHDRASGGATPDAGSSSYDLSTTVAREGILDLSVDGRLDLDRFVLDLTSLELGVRLEEGAGEVVPSSLQRTLREHGVRGSLELRASGQVHAADLAASQVEFEVSVSEAGFVRGDLHVPVRSLTGRGKVADRHVDLQRLDVQLASGSVEVTRGRIRLDAPGEVVLDLRARDLQVQEFLPQREEGASTDIRGLADATLQLRTPLPSNPADLEGVVLQGSGRLEVRDGRLLAVPVLSDIVQATEGVLLPTAADPPGDRLTADYLLVGDQVSVTKLWLDSPFLQLRGEGTVDLDRRLDLRLQGGSVEKVGGLFGEAGELLSTVADALVHYHVTGTIEEPSIELKLGPR